MALIVWNKKQREAANLLAEGYTTEEAAEAVNTSKRTIYRWKRDMEFMAEVYRLAAMIGLAQRGERLMMAKREYRKLDAKLSIKDKLEWLKFIQSETDGVKLDLTALADLHASLADSGPGGDAETSDGDDES